ncbi:MAG: hypothetical protein KME16_00800 [Scytolyngbya sp. HA4215-MV1]|jgi:hypothetical protein|nr:hypothetical protein [Scytolyngbya sp. HA4215-MV1]
MMDNLMDEKELMLDLILTRNLIDSVAEPDWDVLDRCSVSLLRFPSGNALLVTCHEVDGVPIELYKRLVEMAKLTHHQHGKTLICLRCKQQDWVMRWDSECLLRSQKISTIHPSEEML